MKIFKKMKLLHKLTLIFVLVGFIPLILGIVIADVSITEKLEADGIEKLIVDNNTKMEQIKNWANSYKNSLEFMAGKGAVSSSFRVLKQFHLEKGIGADSSFPIETEDYKTIWKEISPWLLALQEQFQFHDLIIMCADHGHVMYTNAKEGDLGTNLVQGKYNNSGLAKVWNKVKETKKTAAVDFEPYAPANNQYSSFIATPIFDDSGTMLGVLAIRISRQNINKIMQDRTGMGKTGESYLVGKHNEKTALRNDMVTMGDGKYVMGYEVHTDYIDKSIAGIKDHGIYVDTYGNRVLVVYSPIEILDFNWACISKINMDEVMKTASHLRQILLIVLGVIGVLVIIIARLIATGLSNPIKEVASVADSLGKGDLTKQTEIKRGDELGELSTSLNNSIIHLSGLVKTVMNASKEITLSSEELATGSVDLASRSQQQAASLTETSATVEQFSAAVKQNSRNADELSSSVESFSNMLLENKQLVEEVSSTMEKIDKSGKRIDAIINVINDISFQTNLLSLNAAIEAARAGEAGKGFAVVASEVRSLAQKTAESSKTIQEIITQNVESTGQGMKLVARTTGSIAELVNVMEKLIEKITHISNASSEQSAGIEQINIAVAQLEEVVSQNAALGEEFSASSESLKHNAHQLQQLVGQFVLDTND